MILMNHFTKNPIVIWLVILVTAFLTYFATVFFHQTDMSEAVEEKKEPLYWVAPMDPNYRRDAPGKSPMGMDLIPVYEEESMGADESPGTVAISPDVVNNLGVRTAVAELQPIHTEIKTVGYVQYDEDKLVHIHPRLEGWIEKLYVKAAGDPVKRGQPLYTLYSPELVNAQEELVLALSRDNTRLIKAAEDRLKALQIASSTISQIKQSRQVQQALTFYAPQSGVVDNLNVREGFYVKPGVNLMSIGDLSTVWVEAEIFERQAEQVQTGHPVIMTLDYIPGREWLGKVDYIYPTLNDETRTVRVRLRFDNDDFALKPNMFAQVTIATGNNQQRLMIPSEALIRTGEQDRVVLALGEGKFKSIAVTAGYIGENSVEIISGLEPGEEVVSSAQFLLDSESSKTSDFKRMHHDNDEPKSVWVDAQITSVMSEHRMLTATHPAIREWDWPAMTMDFTVSEHVDMSPLKKGTRLHMEITKTGPNSYEITTVHIKDEQASQPSHEHDMGEKEMPVDHHEHSHSDAKHSGMH